MSEQSYLISIFNVVEHLIGKDLPETGKRLIINYIQSSREVSPASRARGAVTRYLQADIPSLEEIREKSRASKLSKIDHLVLKMEYEADKLQKQMNP
jgi:hypothetical protein